MIYKKYEFSLSLNGDKIMSIARNAAGMVIFRAQSEKELKNAIDEAIKKQGEQVRLTELDLQKKLAQENRENKKRKPKETLANELVVTQKSITRGHDGKFIGKNQLDQEKPEKKGFWGKLTS